MSRHTLLPWTVGTDTSRGARPGRVHVLYQLPNQPLNRVAVAHDERDADFIVRACNAHDDLLAALRDLVREVSPLMEQYSARDRAALDAAHFAITKATEGA